MKPRPYRLTVYQGVDREWRWRLRAPNGRIVASGEGHRTGSKARRAFNTVQAAMMTGPVVEVS